MIGFEELFNRKEPKEKSLTWREIKPGAKHFFDNILNYQSSEKDVKDFQEAIKDIINTQKLYTFKVPECYFENYKKAKVFYKKVEQLEKFRLPYVRGFCDFKSTKSQLKYLKRWGKDRRIRLGNQFEYYMFLVEVVNVLVRSGFDIDTAMKKISEEQTYHPSRLAFIFQNSIGPIKYALGGYGDEGISEFPPLIDLKAFDEGYTDFEVVVFVVLL